LADSAGGFRGGGGGGTDSSNEVIEIMQQGVKNMIYESLQKFSGRARSAAAPFTLLVMWTTIGAYQGLAQQPAQPTFPSAAEASQSLFQAVQSNNEQTIANILGGPTELTSSRDPGQDKVDRELFVQKYQEMHRLGREPDGSMTLYIGAENWPFPIPIVEKNKAWCFDSDTGTKEVLYRRIGENELTAITICHQFVAGKKKDRAESNAANPEDGSLAILVAKTLDQSAGGDPALFHGYYFRELPAGQTNGLRRGTGGNKAGGFALIAYPAEYRSSGVMTFVVTDTGVVYEKDLGANTSTLARTMAAFRRDRTWHAADE
jgi:hypothetical protein